MADQASVTGHANAPQNPAPQGPEPQNTAAPEPASQRRMLPRVIGARRGGLLATGALALIGLIFAWQAWLLSLAARCSAGGLLGRDRDRGPAWLVQAWLVQAWLVQGRAARARPRSGADHLRGFAGGAAPV